MQFEWDEAKRRANLAKHGFDFVDAIDVFDRPLLIDRCEHATEVRLKAIGLMGDIQVAVIYTVRGDRVRIISIRRARLGERRSYRDIYG